MHREKVTNWELVGEGTSEDPKRPDVFPEHTDGDAKSATVSQKYHYDAENGELYRLVEEDN